MSNQVAARVIKRKPFEEAHDSKDKHTIRLREIKHSEFQTVYEKLAEDRFCYRNWYYPGGKETFPYSREMHVVDRFYPYAAGGPLAFDSVDRDADKTVFEIKREALKKAGIRYVMVKPDTDLLEAMEQLA